MLRTSPTSVARAAGGRGLLVALALAVVVLAGCQVQVRVDTVVDATGAGTVTVAVGFDQPAWERLQAYDPTPVVEDLRQASWDVSQPETGPDGVTWIRATKAFASTAQLDQVLAEISASPMITGVELSRVETDDDITYRLTGQVDLTKGMATFAEPDVAAQLGGDPFGGNVAAIEAAERKPVDQMVSFEFTTTVAGGTPSSVRATLADTAPQPIDVATVEVKPPSFLVRFATGAAIVVGIVVVVLALVGVRRRMTVR